MSLSRQWSLAVCGLVAHADRNFEESEIDQLMSMLEDRVGTPEYASWLETLADPERLRELVDRLTRPSRDEAHCILEQAWIVSMVDGAQCPEERRVMNELAPKLGVDGDTFEQWGETWSRNLIEDAELVTATLVVSLCDSKVKTEKRDLVERVLRGLPLDDLSREELLAATILPLSPVAVAGRLRDLDSVRLHRVLQTASAALRLAVDPASARGRLLALAADLASDLGLADAHLLLQPVQPAKPESMLA